MNANRLYPKYISMMKTTDLKENNLLEVEEAGEKE
jgi:hypothetical protein